MPRREYHFWVYILASPLQKPLHRHHQQSPPPHRNPRGSRPRHPHRQVQHPRLAYFEHFTYVLNAIAREKEIKKYTRAQKIALIESKNPTWQDLTPKS